MSANGMTDGFITTRTAGHASSSPPQMKVAIHMSELP